MSLCLKADLTLNQLVCVVTGSVIKFSWNSHEKLGKKRPLEPLESRVILDQKKQSLRIWLADAPT